MTNERSEEELRLGALHVMYEVEAMVECAHLLREGRHRFVRNALLEAMLLHARAVIEFLARTTPPRGDHDDIWSGDFVDGWNMDDRGHWHDKVRPSINKHLSHLTWTRVTAGTQAWPYPDIAERLLTEFEKFAEHCGEKRSIAHDIFTDECRRIQQAYRSRTGIVLSATTSGIAGSDWLWPPLPER